MYFNSHFNQNSRRNIRSILNIIMVFMFLPAFFSLASTAVTQFERFSLEQGLSQVSVFDIVQDHKGFLWFATEDGLNRYDGYNFKVFRHDPSLPNTISHNNINTLYVDSAGVLWIGTNGGGLSYYDAKTETFTHFKHDNLNPDSLSHNIVWVIIEEAAGIYLVGTEKGLNRLNFLTGKFDNYQHNPDNSDSISANRISSLYKDSRDMLWVGTYDGGLNRFDAQKQKFYHYMHDPLNTLSLSHNRVNAIAEDNQGLLWLGTSDGLNRFDMSKKSFTQFKFSNTEPNSLSHSNVRSLTKDNNGTLWIGTEGGGLNRHDGEEEGFTYYKYQVEDVKSLSTNIVLSILEDQQGGLWLGSQGAGVSKLTPQRQRFGHYVYQASESSNSKHDIVMAISKDREGALWLGTADGVSKSAENGLDLDFIRFKHQLNNANSLAHNNTWAIQHDNDNVVWLGTRGGGLDRFNYNTGNFSNFKHKTSDPSSLSNNDIMTLLKDNKETLWIGTLGGGLNRYNAQTQNFQRFSHNAEDPNSLNNNMVTKVVDDGNDGLWIGTLGGGLNHFDKITERFISYQNQPENENSLSDNSIFSIYSGSLNTLWIGTKGGLNKFDIRSKTFTRYREKDGLANDTVYGILEDNQKNLWLSTNKGLSRFNPITESFKNYDANDGLQSNEFNIGASFKSDDGELFFGGINGFNRFFPEKIHDDTDAPKVIITDMLLLNKSVPVVPIVNEKNDKSSSSLSQAPNIEGFKLAQVIHETKAITLTYQDNIIAFEFTSLHFTNPKKNQFAYQLVGWDKNWVSTDYKNRRATYTNLPYGDYTFRVKASNADGHWNNTGASLQITVLPPPWKTWWAYTLYGVFLLSVIFSFIHSQRKKVIFERNVNAQLESKVKERTSQLQSKTEELQKSNTMLEELSLTDQLTGLKNRRFLLNNIDNDIVLVLRKYQTSHENKNTDKLGTADLIFFLIDLDLFKKVNDIHGHKAGDAVLIQIKAILEQIFRETDYLVRWGGEEFLVIARFTERDNAPELAERLRQAVENHEFVIAEGIGDDSKILRQTCSIGFACYPFSTQNTEVLSWVQVVDIADHCMYAAKKSTRNAWVGLYNKNNGRSDDLFTTVIEQTQSLIQSGELKMLTSIADVDQINWLLDE